MTVRDSLNLSFGERVFVPCRRAVPLVLAPGAVRLAVAPLLQRDAETTYY